MKTCMTGISTIDEAYSTIHQFFSDIHLHEAIQQIDELIHFACSEQYFTKRSPASMMFFVQQLQGLCNAAEIIYYSFGKRSSAIIYAKQFEDLNPIELLPAEYSNHAWENFPRHLGKVEFLNPYWVFEKFGHHRCRIDWEAALQSMLESALSKVSIEGEYTCLQVTEMRYMLMALVEGCGLVEVRA